MRIEVYGYEYCPYTRRAAALASVPVIPASVITGCKARSGPLREMADEVRAAGHTTVPMCFDMHRKPKERFVGGYDKLVVYMAARRKSGGGAKAKRKGTK